MEISGEVGFGDLSIQASAQECIVGRSKSELFASSRQRYVYYEIDEQSTTSTFSTIDQFGINELQASSVKWICVRAAFLRDKSK